MLTSCVGSFSFHLVVGTLRTGRAKSPEEKAHEAAVKADLAAGGDGTLGMSSVVGYALL